MYCSKCGSPVQDTEKFCSQCGNAIREQKKESLASYAQNFFASEASNANVKIGIIQVITFVLLFMPIVNFDVIFHEESYSLLGMMQTVGTVGSLLGSTGAAGFVIKVLVLSWAIAIVCSLIAAVSLFLGKKLIPITLFAAPLFVALIMLVIAVLDVAAKYLVATPTIWLVLLLVASIVSAFVGVKAFRDQALSLGTDR